MLGIKTRARLAELEAREAFRVKRIEDLEEQLATATRNAETYKLRADRLTEEAAAAKRGPAPAPRPQPEEWEKEKQDISQRLFVAEQTIQRLDSQRSELITTNDLLNREAVDRAGTLAKLPA